MLEDILRAVEENRECAISSLQKLIQAPSPSGEEGEATKITADEMEASGFDDVVIDRLNDAMGTIKGADGAVGHR